MGDLKIYPLAKLKVKSEDFYFQTLKGHTKDALKILKAYIMKSKDVIEEFCKRWNLNYNQFLKSLYLTVYLHDIGKLTKEFQENIKHNKHSQRYPHALYGALLVAEILEENLMEIPLEVAAILGHHTQLYDQIYSDDNNYDPPTLLVDEIENFLKDIYVTYKELGFDAFFTMDKSCTSIKMERLLEIPHPKVSIQWIRKKRKHLIIRIKEFVEESKNWLKIKSVFTYIFSILQTCDDYSSAYFSEFINKLEVSNKKVFDSVLENPEQYVPHLEIDNPLRVVFNGKTLYPFQNAIQDAGKFVTLLAPCGRGKTEAALIWALSTLKKNRRNKIVFAMPTQTTSNAMYDRLKEMFGKEMVGLYHGRSFIKLKDEIYREDEYKEEKDEEYLRSENFKNSVFFKPITVTTIDHLIYSFIKGFPQADFACGNLQNAVIIFDEVHYYEKMTLEHLITLFGILKKMDVPHLLMSGTFPEFIGKYLDDEYVPIIDREGLDFTPFKLELQLESIFEQNDIQKIIENYEKGLNQFIILNTVERAKEFYKLLKKRVLEKQGNPNILLYHSQFTYADRVKKERDIYKQILTKPFILVATQVIEISLDISADVMYTELAPPDALGQRAGRLNRGKKTWMNEIEHVFNVYIPSSNHPYPKDVMDSTQSTINNYVGIVSYEKIKELCDAVYTNYTLQKPSKLLPVLKRGTIFGDHWKELATETEEGLKFNVRDETIQKIDVIPENIYERYGDDALTVENMVKIPIYYFKNQPDAFYIVEGRKGRRFIICKYLYDSEIGFHYDDQTFTNNNII